MASASRSATRRPVGLFPKSRKATRIGRVPAWAAPLKVSAKVIESKAKARTITLLLSASDFPKSSRTFSNRVVGFRAVIKLIDFVFHFRGKANTMQFIATLQTTDGFADFADLANLRMRVAVFDVDASARLSALSGVVAIIRNIARPIFDEVVFRREPAARDHCPRSFEKTRALVDLHVEVDGLEQTPTHESPAQIAEHSIGRTLPLFQVKDNIRVVDFQVLGDGQRLPTQNLFKRRAGRAPDFLATLHQFQRAAQSRTQHGFR